VDDAERVLKEIERMTRNQFLPIVGPRKGQVLVETIRRIKPKRVLEVGTLIGYSAILMGKELGKEAHLVTIEIHADEADVARKNIKKAKIAAETEVIVGDAMEVIPLSMLTSLNTLSIFAWLKANSTREV
jgi:predicted O-methyltransferase YrrM